jgi:hypothetical protein
MVAFVIGYMVVTQESLIVFIIKTHTCTHTYIYGNWDSLCNSRLIFGLAMWIG